MSGKAVGRVELLTFLPGVVVRLFVKSGDFVPASGGGLGRPVATAKTDGDGVTVFDGLEPGARFWAVGTDPVSKVERWVTTVATVPVEGKTRVGAPREADRSTWPAASDVAVTGARGSLSRRVTQREREKTGVPAAHDRTEGRPEEAPFRKIADRSGSEKLVSVTAMGAAVPAVPDDEQPHPRQDGVPRGAAQASDTPLGEATIIDKEKE